mgnify:CR=1 FL=1
MSNELNEVSTAIGRLMAVSEEGQRQREAMFRKLDEIANTVHQSIGQAKLVSVEVENVKKKINEFQPVIDEMKTLKQRGIGALAVIGIGAGSISAAITKLVSTFTGIVPH